MSYSRHFLTTLIFLLLTAAVKSDDGAVMQKLSSALTQKPSSWSTETDFCKWEGITCDNSRSVTNINLVDKKLSGTLVSDLKQLSQLQTLAVPRNGLSGAVPDLSGLASLNTVLLDANNFTSFPADNFFHGLTSLQVFTISDNLNLAPWGLPDKLTDASNLQTFQASNANITGTIPDIFVNLRGLQNLRLSYNNLTGELPKSFSGSGIQNLWLNNQKQGLSGNLGVVSLMSELRQVWLQKNKFSGAIPDFSNRTALFDLQLRDNQLTGLVPKSLMSLSSLANVSLQGNRLQGPVPQFNQKGILVDKYQDSNSFCLSDPCDPQVSALLDVAGAIGYPYSLAETWKGDDACAALKFVSCDSLKKNVIGVNLANQMFSGTISPAFANLTSLISLSLNNNSFVGTIPEELTKLPNLQLLNVSHNDLSGKLPVFPPKVNFMYAENPNIGKDMSNTSGSGSGSGNAGGGSKGSKKGSSGSGTVIGIVIGVIVFVVILLFVSYKCYTKKRNQKAVKVLDPESGKEIVKASVIGGGSNAHKVGTELQSQGSSDHAAMHVFEGGNVNISIDVLRQVTDNFSENNILGRGGFGVVYKGELQDGTKIAVKRMEAGVMGTKGLKEFQAEIAVLTKVRHRHLVALLGYCVNGNERLLVYEYMPQGTLSEHLFERQDLKTNPLSWKQRVSIALDVGRGIEYLHTLAQQSFIHRDLKPSNILLDDAMRAKVADFGLVKNALDRDGKFSVETRLAGTFGYLAPEYAATGRVTAKVDVYAFGVVLMELITGRKALDETKREEERQLVTWFRRLLISEEKLVNSFDQTLDTNEKGTLESIMKVVELAGHCTAREPYQRPDMGHAVNVLVPLVEQWKPSQPKEDDDGNSLNIEFLRLAGRRGGDEGTSTMYDRSIGQTQPRIADTIKDGR